MDPVAVAPEVPMAQMNRFVSQAVRQRTGIGA